VRCVPISMVLGDMTGPVTTDTGKQKSKTLRRENDRQDDQYALGSCTDNDRVADGGDNCQTTAGTLRDRSRDLYSTPSRQIGQIGHLKGLARRASARGRFLVVEITSQGVAALWLVKFAYGSEKCCAECQCLPVGVSRLVDWSWPRPNGPKLAMTILPSKLNQRFKRPSAPAPMADGKDRWATAKIPYYYISDEPDFCMCQTVIFMV
jgi:hypothetical protein